MFRRLSSPLVVILTMATIGLLWVAPLALYAEMARQIAGGHRELLLAALPIQPLPRSLLVNTLALCGLTTLLSLLLGLPVGHIMARGRRPWNLVCTLLTALPLTLPPTLIATAWLDLTRTPPARSLASLGADHPMPLGPVHVSALVLALCFYPIVAYSVRHALLALPPACEEAALLYESRWQVWRQITWPQLVPYLVAACGVVCALTAWEMGAPDLLDARTYAVQIYRNLNAPDDLTPAGKWARAAAAGLPMLLLGALALWPLPRLLRRSLQPAATMGAPTRGDASNGANRVPATLTMAALLVVLVSPLAPIGIYVAQIRPASVLVNQWKDNSAEIFNTVLLATLGALAIVLLGVALSSGWRAWPPRARRLALWATLLPGLVPPVLLGVALINFWNRPQFALIYGGMSPTDYPAVDWCIDFCSRYAMMLIAYMARFLPLGVAILYLAARRVPADLLQAAGGLGATPGRATRTVMWPLLAPAAVGTFGVTWALCAAELATSVLVNAPGGQTLPVPIFNLMHIGSIEQVAALSLTLTALCMLVVTGVAGGLYLSWQWIGMRSRRAGASGMNR